MQSNFLHSIPTYLMFNLTYEVLKDYRDGGTEPGMGKISGMRKQGRRVRGAKTTEGIADLYGRTRRMVTSQTKVMFGGAKHGSL